MGHFFPPPPPQIVAANVQQPFAGPLSPPSTLAVPNPPFVHPSRTPQVVAENASIAQPDPWVYDWLSSHGGNGPYQPAQLWVPPPPPEPPHAHPGRWPYSISQSANQAQPDPWVHAYENRSGRTGPFQQGYLIPPPPPNPPFSHQGRPQNVSPDVIVRAWQAPDWPYVFTADNTTGAQPYGPVTAFPGQSPPNPPFINANWNPVAVQQIASQARPDPWPYVFLDNNNGGQPYVPGPYQPIPTVVVVTYTPYTNAWMATVLSSWQPPDPAPTLPRQLSPGIPGQSVDNPRPIGGQQNIQFSWVPPDPPPTLPRQLSPGIPGQSVDNPPIIGGWQSVPPPGPPIHIDAILGVPQPTTAVAAQTPYANAWVINVLSSWQQPDPSPTLPRYLPASQLIVPNPPFINANYNPASAWNAAYWDNLTSWPYVFPASNSSQPYAPGRYTPIPTVVVVTQGPYANLWMASVIQQWQPVDPAPTLPRYGIPSAPPNPPFGFRPFIPPPVIPDPAPTLPIYYPQAFVPPVVNNPPFGYRGFVPTTFAPTIFIPGISGVPIPGAAVTVQVPYTNYWYTNVIQAWQADPWPYSFQGLTAGQPYDPGRRFTPSGPVVVVTQGPYANLWLATVLAAWQPADPPPQQLRPTAAPPGWSVDNPPGAYGFQVVVLDERPPQQGYPRFTVGIPVNNPPFSHYGRAAWIATLTVQAWQPPDPLPTLSGKLNPSITAVPVNNPPFGSRTELPGILAQWATWPPSQFPTPYAPPPQVQPAPPPPFVPGKFTVSGPDVSTYLQEFFYDVVYTDAPITKRTV